MSRIVEVAAAVLLREGTHGTEYLLAQRPQGKVYAGYWEFPGGKVEAGESFQQALVREIQEELGVTIDRAWPWLSCEFTYPHAKVRLKFFRAMSWHGEIKPLEHSGIVWVGIGDDIPVTPVLPANGPILRALTLPATYAITNAAENGIDSELGRLEAALANGLRLVQIRDKTLSPGERRQFAEAVMTRTSAYPETRVLVNDDELLARDVGAHGVHFSSARLAQLTRRPSFEWVAASCHSSDELAHASTIGVDFALLGPVLPTPTHPEARGMGWPEFARLVEHAPIPVFALGGMRRDSAEEALSHGAHGIALMRGWR